MVVRYLPVCCFLVAPLQMRACLGFHRGDAGSIKRSALEDARSVDIFERIRLASGYPLNRSPLSKSLRMMAKNRPRKLGEAHRISSRGDRKHVAESGNPGGRKKWEAPRGEKAHGEEFADEHRRTGEVDFEDFKGGYRSGRTFLVKEYENEHRKDETKSSDSFWDVWQTEGKWFERKRKEKGEKKGKERKGSEERGKAEERETGKKEKENTERVKEEAEGVEWERVQVKQD